MPLLAVGYSHLNEYGALWLNKKQRLKLYKRAIIDMIKCQWALASPLEETYHDHEWGVPIHDDRLLFEFLILEGAQAGLSWATILKKREGYRAAFNNFDAQQIAEYGESKINELLANPNIIRNKLKINSAILNAQAFLDIQKQTGSFNEYIWQFVEGKPIQNKWQQFSDIPVSTSQSERMSRALKQKGFKFVGPTICYAYMQAVGMVNDHTVDCFRFEELIR
jgi:DNA-3-methyladenine glycosylase I